jgi:hypothetical protein
MNRKEVIEKLCSLMSRANNLVGWHHPADCICGESDERKTAWEGAGAEYQNDGAALQEIERLIGAELEIRKAFCRSIHREDLARMFDRHYI